MPAKKKKPDTKLKRRELATIRAALRFYQAQQWIPYEIDCIATDDGSLRRLTRKETETLIQKLNQ